jgi:hypothetical protein
MRKLNILGFSYSRNDPIHLPRPNRGLSNSFQTATKPRSGATGVRIRFAARGVLILCVPSFYLRFS